MRIELAHDVVEQQDGMLAERFFYERDLGHLPSKYDGPLLALAREIGGVPAVELERYRISMRPYQAFPSSPLFS